jgi:phage anti-repressor protein
MIELIKISQAKIGDEEQHVVSARDLHKKLGVKRDFTHWIKIQIKRGAFEENLDFVVVWSDPLKEDSAFLSETEMLKQFKSKQRAVASGYQSDYILTLVTATNIVRVITHNPKTAEIYKYLTDKNNQEVYIVQRHRKEIQFFNQLEELLKPMGIKLYTQYPILNYIVDGYIREANLIIEFDEEYHYVSTQQARDRSREATIKANRDCKLIRLDHKNSNLFNMGLVLKELCNSPQKNEKRDWF